MRYLSVFLLMILFLSGCRKDHEMTGSGKVEVTFSQRNNGTALVLDTVLYRTSSGNYYKVTDLQYFVSGMTLYHNGGAAVPATSDGGIHYADVRIPATFTWVAFNGVETGIYDSLSFIFGLNESENTSNRFPDPPERDMAWPEILGGGYHYMKMNMMYGDAQASVSKPFMFHLGIGQIYSSAIPNPDSITGYVQNWFRVTLRSSFTVEEGKTRSVTIVMETEKWFDGPVTFDFRSYPGGVMQYQAGMYEACLNGREAFSLNVNH